METLIQITGLRYDCEEAGTAAAMAALEQYTDEVLLVTEHTHDFGIVVLAMTGMQRRGVVSRFDLEMVLAIMRQNNTQVLSGKVALVDHEGLCYNVSLSPRYVIPNDLSPLPDDLWAAWSWTGAPIMDTTSDDRRLDISMKVATAELKRSGMMNKETLLEHLRLILLLARWDVCRETQAQLGEIRRLLSQHKDPDVSAIAPQLRHTLTALGSRKRTTEFQEKLLPEICNSAEAGMMQRQWVDLHKANLSNLDLWKPTIQQQLHAIDDALVALPADLYYQQDHFGELMHRLLYLNIPRRKLLMLQSALVLKRQLRHKLGLQEDNTNHIADKQEQLFMQRIAPIFYGDTDSAREFLALARDRRPTEITHLTNVWVNDKRICAAHCRRPLWSALHDAGIYTASESNWNMQVEVRKW